MCCGTHLRSTRGKGLIALVSRWFQRLAFGIYMRCVVAPHLRLWKERAATANTALRAGLAAIASAAASLATPAAPSSAAAASSAAEAEALAEEADSAAEDSADEK